MATVESFVVVHCSRRAAFQVYVTFSPSQPYTYSSRSGSLVVPHSFSSLGDSLCLSAVFKTHCSGNASVQRRVPSIFFFFFGCHLLAAQFSPPRATCMEKHGSFYVWSNAWCREQHPFTNHCFCQPRTRCGTCNKASFGVAMAALIKRVCS